MRHRYNLSFRREQQKKERIKRIVIIAIVLFVFAVLGTLIYFAWTGIDWGALKNASDDKQVAEEPKKPKTVELTINSVGEVTCYNTQLNAAETDDGYDFSGSFENIKKQIEDADLSLFDLETTFGDKPYQGYPRFNSPDELADALKGAGFDIAVTANEHALDSDIEGLERTIDTLDDAGLKAAGTKKDKRDKDYLITTVSGIKVGVVAYAQETSHSADNRTLNDNSMSEEEATLINSYSPDVLDEDMKKIKSSIHDAKADGAKVIICYFHWGEDYDTEANKQEKDIAESLADMGADMIFATNPHVIQEMDSIKTEDDRDVPVFYSLGNFLSAQRYETVGMNRVEQGMIAQVKLTFDMDAKKITDIEYGYIPTWTDMYWNNDLDANVFKVIPLTGDLTKNSVLEESDHQSDAESALEDIMEILGDPIADDKDDTKDTGGTKSENVIDDDAEN